jgi:hypothetical protein
MPYRKKVSQLIIQVLAQEITIQDAIKNFPTDTRDESVECALHALMHYDADDDFRKNNPEYADEQHEYLENLAILLQNGEPLPINVIEEYRKYYEQAPALSAKGWKNILKQLLRFTI